MPRAGRDARRPAPRRELTGGRSRRSRRGTAPRHARSLGPSARASSRREQIPRPPDDAGGPGDLCSGEPLRGPSLRDGPASIMSDGPLERAAQRESPSGRRVSGPRPANRRAAHRHWGAPADAKDRSVDGRAPLGRSNLPDASRALPGPSSMIPLYESAAGQELGRSPSLIGLPNHIFQHQHLG